MKNTYFFIFLLFPFLVIAQQAQEVALLGTWHDPSLVGSSAFDNTYNEIWGYATDDREYAIIGSTAGTHFIDVTDPENPVEVVFVAGAEAGPQIIHRDYHDYAGYLYAIADEGSNSTLQIMDLSGLPNSVEVVYDSNELIRRSHNIFIDSSQAKLYALATASPSGYAAMRIFDLSNPTAPTTLGSYNTFGGNTIGHVHDAYVKDNIAFLNCGYNGLFVVDFSEDGNPMLLGTMTDYLQSGYNHSGWATEDGNFYYFADENHGYDLKAVDISNFGDMTINSFFDAGEQADPNSIPHNLIVRGNYLYVSYYYDGLQVYDISDPANPVRAYYYDTSTLPNEQSYKGAWGVYPFLPSGNILVSDMQNGLFVVEAVEMPTGSVSTPDAGVSLSLFPQPANEYLAVNIQVEKATQNTSLQLLDLTGRQVWAKELSLLQGENNIRIEEIYSLPAGCYLLNVKGDTWQLTERLIISR